MSSAAEPPVPDRRGADGEAAAAAGPVAWPGSGLIPGPFAERAEPAEPTAAVGAAPDPTAEQRAVPAAASSADPYAVPRAESPVAPNTELTADLTAAPGTQPTADLSAEPPVAPSTRPAAGLSAAPTREPQTDPSAEPPADPTPEPTGRARFRVLTGGRAAVPESASEAPAVTADDLSDTDSVDAVTPGPDFRVRCPDCGPQYVAIADVRFVSTGGGADTDRYLFTCPACGLRVRRPAGPELARILKTSGVATLALRRATDQAL